jgi:hypothetical protein
MLDRGCRICYNIEVSIFYPASLFVDSVRIGIESAPTFPSPWLGSIVQVDYLRCHEHIKFLGRLHSVTLIDSGWTPYKSMNTSISSLPPGASYNIESDFASPPWATLFPPSIYELSISELVCKT